MNARVIKDLRYKWYLKILLKLHEPYGEYNLKEFSNITSSVSPLFFPLKLHAISWAFIWLLIYYIIENIANARALICTAV